MESGAVRRRRLTRVRVQREAVQHRHNFICVYVGQPLIVATYGNHPVLNSVALVSWLIYECIEERVIHGGSNNKSLTDVGTQSISIIISLPMSLY